MRPFGIINQLRISAAALRKNTRRVLGGGYEIVPVLSFPQMLYLASAAKTGTAGTGKNSVNIVFHGPKSIYRLAAYFGNIVSYSASSRIRKLGYISDSLFSSYTDLNQLTKALWSIYKSNDLQLSHSLLALIRTINEKNGIELDAYFEGLPRIVQTRKKMISVLKSIDRSLFGKISSRYVHSSFANIGKREIYRHTDTVARGFGKPTTAFSRLTENFYSMTPLLMRIYEGIETGVYLYGVDSYRNAKTLRRLTNSLWKVYLGQNMELSRSFSRLITRVHLESKSVELRNAENNMFSDNRSLKNLVNALRKAFSGSSLELRNSMVTLFGDVHKAGSRKNISVNKRYDLRSAVGIILLHKETVPEFRYIRLEHRTPAWSERTEQQDAYNRLERDIKAKFDRLEASSKPTSRTNGTEDIVRDILEKINRKQQLDWRLEKLQRGIF